MGRAVGLREVAAHAGVSVKTVSNVVNDYPHVSAELRARVRGAITDLDYRPNIAARNLRRGRTDLIALAVPDLKTPYFAQLASDIVDRAAEFGLTVLIEQTGGERDRERHFLSGTPSRHVDAMIMAPSGLTRADLEGRRGEPPLVVLGETLTGDAETVRVSIDSHAAGADATRHLLELGRTRIAAIGRPQRTAPRAHRRRLSGYTSALRASGLPDRIVPITAVHPNAGFDAMAQLCTSDTPPDAVFCCNDVVALGAIRYLLTAGYRVPADVAVIGFDDIDEGRYITPSLSTVAPDRELIARSAVAAVVAPPGRSSPAIPYRIVARESTVNTATRTETA